MGRSFVQNISFSCLSGTLGPLLGILRLNQLDASRVDARKLLRMVAKAAGPGLEPLAPAARVHCPVAAECWQAPNSGDLVFSGAK